MRNISSTDKEIIGLGHVLLITKLTNFKTKLEWSNSRWDILNCEKDQDWCLEVGALKMNTKLFPVTCSHPIPLRKHKLKISFTQKVPQLALTPELPKCLSHSNWRSWCRPLLDEPVHPQKRNKRKTVGRSFGIFWKNVGLRHSETSPLPANLCSPSLFSCHSQASCNLS